MTNVTPSGDHGPAVDATQARQGRPGKPVLLVLVVSLALVVIAFGVIWALHAPGFAAAEPNKGSDPQDARAFQTPLSPTKQVPDPATDAPK
jgi:hypothetical protein